jgi:membrane-associated protein
MNTILPYLLNGLQEYGYPLLWLSIFIGALGIPLPNSLVLLAAGAFAAFGDFQFVLLTSVSVSAFVAGDSCGYWIGRFWGSKVLHWLETSGKVPLLKPQTIERSRVYFNRRGGWAIFFSRFLVSGLGGVVNILAGAELYPYRKFFVYDVLGEILGALLPLLLGYVFATSWEMIGDILGSFSLFALAFVIVVFLGYQGIRLFRRLRKLKSAKQAFFDKELLEASMSSSDELSSSSGKLPR